MDKHLRLHQFPTTPKEAFVIGVDPARKTDQSTVAVFRKKAMEYITDKQEALKMKITPEEMETVRRAYQLMYDTTTAHLEALMQAELEKRQLITIKPRRYGMNHMQQQAVFDHEKIREQMARTVLEKELEKAPNQEGLKMKERIQKLIYWAQATQTPILQEVKGPENRTTFLLSEQARKKIHGELTSNPGMTWNAHPEVMQARQDKLMSRQETAADLGAAFHKRWEEQTEKAVWLSQDHAHAVGLPVKEQKNESEPSWAELAAIYRAGTKGDVVSVMQQMQARNQPPAQRSYLEEDDTTVLCVWVRDGVHHSVRIKAGAPIPELIKINNRSIVAVNSSDLIEEKQNYPYVKRKQ